MTSPAQAAPLSASAQRTDKLLAAGREGDDWAFEELLRLHRGPVYRLALGMLGKPEAAADVCQDVFLRFFRTLRRLRSDRGIRAWLRRVAIHRCYDVLRARRRPAAVAELMPGCMQTEYGIEVTDYRQLTEWLLSSLDMLSPRQRAALVLTCHQGYSIEEAAEAMGCRPATVQELVHKAREKLKAAFFGGGERRKQ